MVDSLSSFRLQEKPPLPPYLQEELPPLPSLAPYPASLCFIAFVVYLLGGSEKLILPKERSGFCPWLLGDDRSLWQLCGEQTRNGVQNGVRRTAGGDYNTR